MGWHLFGAMELYETVRMLDWTIKKQISVSLISKNVFQNTTCIMAPSCLMALSMLIMLFLQIGSWFVIVGRR